MTAPLRELAKIVGDDRVSTRHSDRVAYSRDLWQRDILGVREGKTPPGPEVIVWPENAAQVSALVKLAKKRGLIVVPFGAGSGVCGSARSSMAPSELSPGSAPGRMAMDMKRLRAIRSIDADRGIAEVETGILGEVLERELNHRGWTLGHFPSSIYCSTLGGFVAARSAGQLSTKYGKIEDMITGLELVLPSGEIVQLEEGAATPELTQLFVGAEGTLGLCTAAKLRVSRLPEEQILRAWSFDGVDNGLAAIRTLLQAGLKPAVVRLYDEFDTVMALAGKSGPKKKGLAALLSPKKVAGELFGLFPSVKNQAMALALKRPAALNRLAGVLGDRALMILMFEGPRAGTRLEAAEAERLLRGKKATDLGAAPAERWKQRRYAISYNQSKVFAAGAFNDTAEVASTWDKLPALYEGVKAAVGRHAFIMAHFSHAYPEGCSIYFTFVGQSPTADGARALYDRIWADLLAAVVAAGGTISHHHGVGLSKARFLPEELGAGGMKALRALKVAIDPARTFNPGKLGL